MRVAFAKVVSALRGDSYMVDAYPASDPEDGGSVQRCRIASEVALRVHRRAIMLEDRCDQVQRWVARATALVSPSRESAVGAPVAH